MPLNALYITYKSETGSNVTREQFDRMTTFFPALLVIASDGVIDDDEWVYVDFLAKAIADSFKEEVPDKEDRNRLKEEFLAELKQLLTDINKWEGIFIPALKKYLAEYPEIKEDVEDALHLFAEASDGESEEEIAKIEELTELLELDDE